MGRLVDGAAAAAAALGLRIQDHSVDTGRGGRVAGYAVRSRAGRLFGYVAQVGTSWLWATSNEAKRGERSSCERAMATLQEQNGAQRTAPLDAPHPADSRDVEPLPRPEPKRPTYEPRPRPTAAPPPPSAPIQWGNYTSTGSDITDALKRGLNKLKG
jgi:hypothetical protein